MSYNVKGAPFRYKGAIDVSKCNTSEEVMIAAGLDWHVSKCELVGKMPINVGSDFNADLDKYICSDDIHPSRAGYEWYIETLKGMLDW